MKLKAEVLSPVHIGSGRNLTPFDYVVNAGFINYDLTGLLGHEPGITDKIIGGLGKSKSNYFLQSLLDSEQITDPEYWTYKLPASGGVEHNLGRHHPDVDEYVKTQLDSAIPMTTTVPKDSARCSDNTRGTRQWNTFTQHSS